MKTAGVLIDLDGTVYQAGTLLPGAEAAVRELREAGLPLLFSTNTSRKSRADVTRMLAGLGLEVSEDEILTAAVAAARWLSDRGLRRVQLLVPESTHADFAGFEITDEEPEAVLVGDLGAGFTFGRLNAAFLNVRDGAQLVAIQKNRYWLSEDGPALDAGPFVAALEFATRQEAIVVGKPAADFFRSAAAILGAVPRELAIVGDDPETDIQGGRSAGLRTFLVRTGKSAGLRPGETEKLHPTRRPDEVLAEIRELPERLGAGRA